LSERLEEDQDVTHCKQSTWPWSRAAGNTTKTARRWKRMGTDWDEEMKNYITKKESKRCIVGGLQWLLRY
jgi:hypothetical protein